MGKFSDRLTKRFATKKKNDIGTKWSTAIGDVLGLAVEIIELGPDQVQVRLLEARVKAGRAYEDQLIAALKTVRAAGQAQIDVADRALLLIEDCSKQVDEEMKPRLVS
jgi:hypothetical protein